MAAAVAVPADHELTSPAGLIATDLEHGTGIARLAVQRSWAGTETLNTHFGTGWADANVVQLRLADPDHVLIRRGGIGWRIAHRQGAVFTITDGGEIRKTASGWSAHLPGGLALNFDARGLLVSEQPAAGPARTYRYDERSRLVSVGTGADNLLRYHYDKSGGRVIRIDGPEGVRGEYRYDDKGRLSEVVNGRQIRITYRYATNGDLERAGDQFGSEINVPQAIRTAAATAAKPSVPAEPEQLLQLPQIAVEFDDKGRITQETRPDQVTTYAYDLAGRIASISTPQGRTGIGYDTFGRVVSVQQPDGRTTRIEYNRLDLPTKVTTTGEPAEDLRYNDNGMLLRRSRSMTDWEEYAYDAAGRLSVVRRPPAIEERYAYGEDDRVTAIHYSDGRQVAFGYDASGSLASETWSSGEKNSWRYDASGRLTESIDAAGLKTTYTYDGRGRLIASEDSVHGKTEYQHSLASGMTVDHPSLGKSTFAATTWDAPLTITGADGGRSVFRYDERERLQSVVSASGLPWRYAHDPAGRLSAIVSPSSVKTGLQRDAAGRLSAVTRGNVNWRQYRYDAATGRLQQELSAAGLAAGFRYDTQGRIQQLNLPQGKITFSHDPKGRHSVVKGPDYQIDEHYHPNGKLARRIYQPAQLELKLPRDAQGRPAGIELNQLKAGYVYNARSQIERIDLPGGASIQITRDAAGRPVNLAFAQAGSLAISYDQADRITALAGKRAGGQALFDERYTYNAAGNLAQLTTDAAPAKKLKYDRDHQLTAISGAGGGQTFRYDTDGNLVDSGKGAGRWTLDALGRPVQQGATRFGWDAAGNLTLVENAVSKTEHMFDAAGRMVQRRNGKQAWRYGYLPDGDRLWRQGPAGKQWYAYLPDRLAGFKDEIGVTWILVTLPGSNWPLALAGSNGETYFILADRLGSTRRFLDTSGAVVARADYGPFGNAETVEGAPPLALFAGMLRDEGGLFYARQRYYNPQLARFISIDPDIGTSDLPLSHNGYAYAANNPYLYVDDLGSAPRVRPLSAIDIDKPAPSYIQWPDPFHPGMLPDPSLGGYFRPDAGVRLNPKRVAPVMGDQLMRSSVLTHESFHWTQWQLEMKRRGYNPQRLPASVQGILYGGTAAAPGGWINQPGVRNRIERGAVWQQVHYLVRDRGLAVDDLRVQAALDYYDAHSPPGDRAIVENSLRKFTRRASSSRIFSALRALGRGLGYASGIGEVADAAMMGGGAGKTYIDWLSNPTDLASDAEGQARKMNQALLDRIRTLLRTDPSRFLPLSDGRPPDPNNPEDVDQVLGNVSSNLFNNRRPFDGVIKDGPSGPSAADQQALQAALASARAIIADGRGLQAQARNAASGASKQEAEARALLQRAVAISAAHAVAGGDLTSLPVAADDVKAQIAAIATQTAGLQAAYDAMTAAGTRCEAAASQSCGLAQQAAAATPDQLAPFLARRADATNAVLEASNQLNAAQARIDAADVALDQLRNSKSVLEGYGVKLAAFRLGSSAVDVSVGAVQNAWTAAQATAQGAQSQRARLAQSLERLRGIPGRVQTLLAPFAWSAEAAALNGQAAALGQEVDAPSPFNWDGLIAFATPAIEEFLANQRRINQLVTSINIDALVQSANGALTRADQLRTQSSALATSPERYRPLQRASQCLAQLNAAATQLAAATPAPAAPPLGPVPSSPASSAPPSTEKSAQATPAQATGVAPSVSATKEGDMVTVPSVAGADSIEYMRIILQQRGLKSAFKARKPTRKEDELKYAGQNPAAGTKVPRDTSVTVYVYQRFESESPQAKDQGPKDKVPNVVGRQWEEGVSILNNAGFGVSGITVHNAPSQDQAGKIAAQGVPDKNKRIALTRYGESQAASAAAAAPGKPPATGIEAMASGPDREFIGEFKGTMTGSGAPSQISVNIARQGEKWSLMISVPPNGLIGSSTATITMHGGELRYEDQNRFNHTTITIKVSGNQLAGTLEVKDLRHPNLPSSKAKLQATRSG